MSDQPSHLDVLEALAVIDGTGDSARAGHVLACRTCSGLVLSLDPTGLDVLLPSARLMPVARDLYSDRRAGPSGGMGQTWTAIDNRLGRRVLIKEVAAFDDAAGDEAGLQPRLAARLAREARITARLQHPNIVSVYEAGRWADDATAFYAMELVGENGATLAEAVQSAGSLEERLALVPVITGVASAIAHAHERGVVHRDLTPFNVLLAEGRTDSAVVIDWGIAVELDGDHGTDVLGYAARYDEHAILTTGIGTPRFMAPEQAAGDTPPARTLDVFGLGALLYYVVTGHPPGLDVPRARLAPLPRACPPELAAIIDGALARDPAKRDPDAGALAARLLAYQTRQFVDAPRARRRARRLATLLLPLALAGLLAGYLIMLRQQAADERHQAANIVAASTKRSESAERELRVKTDEAGALKDEATQQTARANANERQARQYAQALESAIDAIDAGTLDTQKRARKIAAIRSALQQLKTELDLERDARKREKESLVAAERGAAEARRALQQEQLARTELLEQQRLREADFEQVSTSLARERSTVAQLHEQLAEARLRENRAQRAAATSAAFDSAPPPCPTNGSGGANAGSGTSGRANTRSGDSNPSNGGESPTSGAAGGANSGSGPPSGPQSDPGSGNGSNVIPAETEAQPPEPPPTAE